MDLPTPHVMLLRKGARYRSFAELLIAVEMHSQTNFVHFVKCHTRRVDSDNKKLALKPGHHQLFPERFVYSSVTFLCKHYGLEKRTSKGKRPNQWTYKVGCPAHFVVTGGQGKEFLRVIRFVEHHEHHTPSREIFMSYPERRPKGTKASHLGKRKLSEVLAERTSPKLETAVVTSLKSTLPLSEDKQQLNLLPTAANINDPQLPLNRLATTEPSDNVADPWQPLNHLTTTEPSDNVDKPRQPLNHAMASDNVPVTPPPHAANAARTLEQVAKGLKNLENVIRNGADVPLLLAEATKLSQIISRPNEPEGGAAPVPVNQPGQTPPGPNCEAPRLSRRRMTRRRIPKNLIKPRRLVMSFW